MALATSGKIAIRLGWTVQGCCCQHIGEGQISGPTAAGGTSFRQQWRQRIQHRQLNLPQGSLCPVNAAEQAAAAAAARAYYDMW